MISLFVTIAPMTTQVRSLFISDVHLGTRACQASQLLEFLCEYECQHLLLLGDIIDFWAMRRRLPFWSEAQNTVIQKILRRARKSVQVVYIPGNHDEVAREHVGISFGNIQVHYDYVHTLADGRRLLLLHGDDFDGVTKYHRWVAILGDHAYSLLVRLNILLSWLRRVLGFPGYWSLAGYAKRKVKTAVNFVFDFEAAVIHQVRLRGLDGVICGHIHSAAMKEIDGLHYLNCGDWVDSCTGIFEHLDGSLDLVHWAATGSVAPKPIGATVPKPPGPFPVLPSPLVPNPAQSATKPGDDSARRYWEPLFYPELSG